MGQFRLPKTFCKVFYAHLDGVAEESSRRERLQALEKAVDGAIRDGITNEGFRLVPVPVVDKTGNITVMLFVDPSQVYGNPSSLSVPPPGAVLLDPPR